MKIIARNGLAKLAAYAHLPKTYEYSGEIVATPKWVDYPAIALSTGEKKFPVRIIPQEDIISINDEKFEPARINPSVRIIQVTGSKGDVYIVTIDGSHKTCTCQAYTFRRSCRHIAEAV